MAKLSVSVDVPLPPEQAWESASDLSRFKEWLSIHRMWRSPLPDTIDKGTTLDSIVEVKGMLNRISWTVVHFKPPEAMTLNGVGRGGVKVKLIGKVRPAAGTRADTGTDIPVGSNVQFDVHLGGPALFGPIGMVVASALQSDIQESLNRFKAVFAPS
ncbi:type II toxin-antitoxin system Rv0910 family toxin [Mycobacterium sp. C3-094]|uniref:type II toxin-antitoxin system Rv0910 family toxin n=1 Tax=Mycobacterium sp. PSTR-4-N TaxID=2917745 RepID=UPI001F155C51|nr:SRPBCC family protein [Mycobacterium sp. PSTR-4-N]MCG7593148.1 SRPBCC family protein [Mycobacterium sp. PSTR-4-N]